MTSLKNKIKVMESSVEMETAEEKEVTNKKVAERATINAKPKKGALLHIDSVQQGILWHEILSEPLCKRRRNR